MANVYVRTYMNVCYHILATYVRTYTLNLSLHTHSLSPFAAHSPVIQPLASDSTLCSTCVFCYVHAHPAFCCTFNCLDLLGIIAGEFCPGLNVRKLLILGSSLVSVPLGKAAAMARSHPSRPCVVIGRTPLQGRQCKGARGNIYSLECR